MNPYLASRLEDIKPAPDKDDFISAYMRYTSETECPALFHRWSALTCLSAWLGRSIYFPFGHSKVHANMYVMLIGKAGTKKSTSVKIGCKLLEQAGYKKFAADKIRQEKFLVDLANKDAENNTAEAGMDDILDMNLFGDDSGIINKDPAECFVAADEVNNFIGIGNLEFMSILGELWDIDKVFDYRLKNSESVSIPYPTISILSGNTFAGFSKLFPPEAIEQGFFSRMLFIYGEPTGVKYTIPKAPCPDLQKALIDKLHEIKEKVYGEITITEEAYSILDSIYKSDYTLNDPRFEAYEARRLQHLLKLCMIIAASKVSTVINEEVILEANTILTYTEYLMPKALGEFGRARSSEATHKVMDIIDSAKLPISFQQIWKYVYQDLESRNKLVEILGNLQMAKKIQAVNGNCYLPHREARGEGIKGAIDYSLLTKEEREFL